MKQCRQCQSQFQITDSDRAFYRKVDVPEPVECPLCRQKARIMFRNFKSLYQVKSAKSGLPMISMYAPESPYTVWLSDEWWADDWDDLKYGREFDFSRPFFEQMGALMKIQPRFNIMNTQSESCQFSNFTLKSKHCYLVFGCVEDENCYYGHIVWDSKDCVDGLYLYKCELCYECVDIVNCYNCKFCQECENCLDCIECFDCVACESCIGCVGLRKKQYCIFNEQKTKIEYEIFLRSLNLCSLTTRTMIKEKTAALKREAVHRAMYGSHNQDSTGNHLYNCQNVKDSFDVKNSEDCRFLYTAKNFKDSYDASFTVSGELQYNCLTCGGGGYNMLCSHLCWGGNNIAYSDHCYNCNTIFGCVGLRGKQFCIFNKQYSEEKYKVLRQKIVLHMKNTGEWGRFFPRELSPFAYNESIVNEYYPLSPQETVAQGLRFRTDTLGTFGKETIAHTDIPKDIRSVEHTITKQILACEVCNKNYRIIEEEFALLKRHGVPIPRQCFDCRHRARMALRNPRTLWHRQCMCNLNGHDHDAGMPGHATRSDDRATGSACGRKFETTYAPERSEKVFCEACYQSEII